MIEVKNLTIHVGEKEILHDVTLNFEAGKNYLILGKNGSGKSSLANFLMGNPLYQHISGEVSMEEKNLIEMEVFERAKAGLFLSFQNVPEIPGIQLGEYLRIIYNNFLVSHSPETKPLSPFVFKRFLSKYLQELEIDETFLSRELNVGFSGGEKRKIELLQAKLLEPKYIILDEIDSGLDVNAFQVVAEQIKKFDSPKNSLIVITHHFKILDFVNFDRVYILKHGTLQKSGGQELVAEIIKNGFA